MKNRKRVVIVAIMLILLQISLFSGNVIAEVIERSKDGISWSYDSETGKLTFSGSGEIGYWMKDNNRKENVTTIEIQDGVTSIGFSAFGECTGLTSIEIPNSVTSIGDFAFHDCTGLTSIEIPNSVTSIGDYAFDNCKGLTSIEIPNSVTSIGNYAFEDCTGLTSIEIPNSVTSIGNSAFEGCTGLTSIDVSDGNQNYCSENGVLYNKDKTVLVRYPIGKTDITYEIPASVTSIGYSAFKDCTGLTSIEIPASVTSIGYSAFKDCTGLTSIVIPNSVTSIGNSAFGGCERLTIYCNSNSTAQKYAQEKNIPCVTDDTPPILQLTQEGTYIKITATDNEGGVGLAKIPYSLDGKNWQTNNSIAVETSGEYEVFVKDKLVNVATRKINIDLDKPIINKIDTDGKKIIINARDEISGLAEKAYSLDGENWQASNTIEVAEAGTYRVFVKDAMGNIETGNVTVTEEQNNESGDGNNTSNPSGNQSDNTNENNTDGSNGNGSETNTNTPKEIGDTTTNKKFGQYGNTKRILLIISVLSVIGLISKKKMQKYRM